MEHNTLIQADTPWYKRLKLYRTAAGLTQQELAERINVERRRYWGWEKGESLPWPEHQAEVAAALGVTQDAIFGGRIQDFDGLSRNKATKQK